MPKKQTTNRRRRRPKGGGNARYSRASARKGTGSSQTHLTAQGVGSFLGAGIGGALGHGVSQLFRRFTGRGDYAEDPGHKVAETLEVEKNSLINEGPVRTVTMHSHEAHGATRIARREYIGDIKSAPLGFPELRAYVINPGNYALFPWLSNLASSYEKYRMLGMMVEFVPTSGYAVGGGDASLGSVSIATQYNTALPTFSNKSQLLNHFFATSASPACGQLHAIECAEQYNNAPYFVRNELEAPLAQDAVATDSRLSDMGVVQVLTQGSQTEFVAGELFVTYDIVLYQPRLRRTPGSVFTWDPDTSQVSEDPVDDPSIHIPENKHYLPYYPVGDKVVHKPQVEHLKHLSDKVFGQATERVPERVRPVRRVHYPAPATGLAPLDLFPPLGAGPEARDQSTSSVAASYEAECRQVRYLHWLGAQASTPELYQEFLDEDELPVFPDPPVLTRQNAVCAPRDMDCDDVDMDHLVRVNGRTYVKVKSAQDLDADGDTIMKK